MRVFGLAFGVLFAVTVSFAAQANGLRSNMGPASAGLAPGVVLVWDGGGSGGHSGAHGGQTAAGHTRQWNGQWRPPHWGSNRFYGAWGPYGGPGVPTYWVYVPGSAVFDYPFSDWHGPTGGWVTRSRSSPAPPDPGDKSAPVAIAFRRLRDAAG